ncbi:hypothetical protein BG004_004293, partial [Podila humilis]
YLSQKAAQAIDVELMSPSGGGFSFEQLVELAGLSVAQAVTKVYSKDQYPRIMVFSGPGNNGLDGLVAARHLSHFGYHPRIYYPKRPDKPVNKGLMAQCLELDIPFVDIPENGNVTGSGIQPSMLVSLTAPKLGAKDFAGPHHYLGGRFISRHMDQKWGLNLPPFPGTDQCVKLEGHTKTRPPASSPQQQQQQHKESGVLQKVHQESESKLSDKMEDHFVRNVVHGSFA